MRILILSQHWWPENGVHQRRWTWLSQILTDAGHEVTVIAPPPHYRQRVTMKEWREGRRARRKHADEPLKPGPSGERIIRSGFIPTGPSLTQKILNQAAVALGSLWAILRRPGQLRDYRPDLIIGTVPALPTAVVTYLASKRMKAPYIIDLRDAWPDLLGVSADWNKGIGEISTRERILRKGPLQILTSVTRFGINWSLQRASAILVTSSHLAEDIRKRPELSRGGWKLDTVTVRNVFPPQTSFVKQSAAEESQGELRVLYAGTLGRAQNLANAVNAAAIARQRGTQVWLKFVGTGVATEALEKLGDELDFEIDFEPQRDADELEPFYAWANTALVHLTDWVALDMAVPSKTYELMDIGIHISGVVSGEPAELIRSLGAGDVVEPENPEALAQLWCELAEDRSRLAVGEKGADWVRNQRSDAAPAAFLELVERFR